MPAVIYLSQIFKDYKKLNESNSCQERTCAKQGSFVLPARSPWHSANTRHGPTVEILIQNVPSWNWLNPMSTADCEIFFLLSSFFNKWTFSPPRSFCHKPWTRRSAQWVGLENGGCSRTCPALKIRQGLAYVEGNERGRQILNPSLVK